MIDNCQIPVLGRHRSVKVQCGPGPCIADYGPRRCRRIQNLLHLFAGHSRRPSLTDPCVPSVPEQPVRTCVRSHRYSQRSRPSTMVCANMDVLKIIIPNVDPGVSSITTFTGSRCYGDEIRYIFPYHPFMRYSFGIQLINRASTERLYH